MGAEASKEEMARIEAATQAELAQQTAMYKKQAEDEIEAQQAKTNAQLSEIIASGQPSAKLKRSSKGQASTGPPKRPNQQKPGLDGEDVSSVSHGSDSMVKEESSSVSHGSDSMVKEESISEGEVDEPVDEGPLGDLLTRNTGSVKKGKASKQLAPTVQDPKQTKSLAYRNHASDHPAVVASGSRRPQPPTETSADRLSEAVPNGPRSGSARHSMASAFAEERRAGLARLGKIPKRAATSPTDEVPKKKVKAPEKEVVTSIDERPPRWYNSLKFENSRKPSEAQTSKILEGLKADIKKTQDPGFFKDVNKAKQHEVFNNIRKRLHEVPFQPVSAQLLRNNRMLHEDSGLPILFEAKYPWDIRADAEEQYNKWCLQEFETDLLHHIERGVPKKGAAIGSVQDRVDPNFKKSAKFFGNGLLLNGQWWPTQLASFRDGAHGETIKGISGSRAEGAYSCIMSGGTDYDNKNGEGNEDMGDVVSYCGMDSTTGKITEETQMLMRNEEGGSAKPVRLIRSHQCPNKAYAPEIGFRYDGLYEVVSHQRIDPEASTRQRIRFKLVRLRGQDPIRGGDGPERRPTDQEMKAYRDDKRMRGYA